MIKNYFKIAFRSFWRHKLFTLINIIGLSIGISASVVIFLIVHYDFTFDKFHQDSERIYRVVSDFEFQGQKSYSYGVTTPLAAAVRSEVTGIEYVAPLYTLGPDVSIPNYKGAKPKIFKAQDRVTLADKGYFKIFKYKWLAGSAETSLNEPNQTVLSSEQAKLYFPSLSYQQMLGKIVTYDTLKTTVTGIVQTLTENTDFTFHHFISYSSSTANKALGDNMQLTSWGSTNSACGLFIKILPKANPATIKKQLAGLMKKYNPPAPNSNGSSAFNLQPLSDIHFDQLYGTFDFSSTANKNTLYGLLAIAAFLLVLGCINFINLTTAQATQRAKEIGIRKTMGSSRKQLIFQFLSETFLITLFAVIISIVLTPVILKLFGDFISPNIKADLLGTLDIILSLIGLTLVVSVLAGFYPALMLSGYKPVAVLKNQAQSNSSKTRNAWLRKSLTVSQFIIAQFFIMATVLVSKQIYFALHKDIGSRKDAILYVTAPYKVRTVALNKLLLNKFRTIPQIEMAGLANAAPFSGNTNSTIAIYKNGKTESKTAVEIKSGDENYIGIYGIKLLAGRNIQVTDTGKALVINNSFAKLMGFKTPQDAIGKVIEKYNGQQNVRIVGVVTDFYERSIHTAIKPLVVAYGTGDYQTGTLHVRLKRETAGGNEWKTAIAAMTREWKKIYPNDDFSYQFYDESIKQFYNVEQHMAELLRWATGLCILISCLGLIGLAIYTTNQRTKEIGVRKVLGATVAQIVRLLSAELVWLIVLASVVVTPFAWYAMNYWLQGFAERTSISWWIFATSAIGMLLAAIFTSSFQTIKAAIANPVKSLRSE